MTIKFTPTSENSGVNEDLTDLIDMLNNAVVKSERGWDVRTIYSALTVLQETYREAMRSAWIKDKESFDTFIDTMNVYLTTYASELIRPVFEGVIDDAKNEKH